MSRESPTSPDRAPVAAPTTRGRICAWLLLGLLLGFMGTEVAAAAEPQDLGKARSSVRVAARCAPGHGLVPTHAAPGGDLFSPISPSPVARPALSSPAEPAPFLGIASAARAGRADLPRSPPSVP
jgi:hypothetical protein